MNIKPYLQEQQTRVDAYLKSYFSSPIRPPQLFEAMKYSLFAGGKRIRPILALASYEACGRNPEEILHCASALELIHTYSLIHDDLPAMDDDDLRRGKPSNHKVFGEAIAILAGDALLTEAFSMIVTMQKPVNIPATSIVRVIREIAQAAGVLGMVGGQAQDILSENTEIDSTTLDFIHRHKTAALIAASVKIGPILADAGDEQLHRLSEYGETIGLAFQIIDDILDVEGSTEELGKTAGSDLARKKATYPSLFGVRDARNKARDLITAAIDALAPFSEKADPLREIAVYLIERKA
jgi:geranylgeranyl diphosphate synthase type II